MSHSLEVYLAFSLAVTHQETRTTRQYVLSQVSTVNSTSKTHKPTPVEVVDLLLPPHWLPRNKQRPTSVPSLTLLVLQFTLDQYKVPIGGRSPPAPAAIQDYVTVSEQDRNRGGGEYGDTDEDAGPAAGIELKLGPHWIYRELGWIPASRRLCPAFSNMYQPDRVQLESTSRECDVPQNHQPQAGRNSARRVRCSVPERPYSARFQITRQHRRSAASCSPFHFHGGLFLPQNPSLQPLARGSAMRIKRYADVPVKIDVVTTSFVVGGAILWAVAAALDAIEFYARTRGNVAESDHQYRVLVMTAVQSKEFDTIEQIDPHTIVGEAEGPEGGSEDEMVGGKKCGVAVDMRWETQGQLTPELMFENTIRMSYVPKF
ncbi:hypothetical protein C8J57DRAFT_1483767 [Mycena rebaudengoi]|nr:hypothetical protein C8J57DRAFT_1483767 [Mycena rebaudengoi]